MKGGDNCSCPCREYWTTKCSIEYRTECKQLYTHRECKKIPEEKPMRVKETECQKCIRYYETVMETKSTRQCVDVYDEKCETKYPAKCSEDQSCTMLYQTKCENVGYSQKCQQVPVRKCQSITKCHRIPKTTCRPFKKEKCGNKAIPTPVKKLKHKCLPYEAKPSENLASCGVKNNNSPSSGYGAPGNGNNPSSGYGAPGNNNNPSSGYRAPQGNNKPSYSGQNNAIPRPPPPPTVADMLAPIGPMPSNNQDSYGSPLNNVVQTTLQTNTPLNPFTTTASNPNQDSYGSPGGSPISGSTVSNLNPNQDSYGIPGGSPISGSTNSNLTPNQDFNGTPRGSPIVNKYVSPSSTQSSDVINAISAPQSYSAPSANGDYTNMLTLTTRRRQPKFQGSGTTLATIKVVDPPLGLVGRGPFLPSGQSNPILNPIKSQRTEKLHPNQLLRDFRPSVRLPENFVHQIGNMVVNPDTGEMLHVAQTKSTKKMIFPESSEELLENEDEEYYYDEDEYYEDYEDNDAKNATTTSKPETKKEVMEEEETSEEISGEYDYDYYNEDAIQTLLLTSTVKALDDAKEDKEEEKDDKESDNPFLVVKRKRKRRRRPSLDDLKNFYKSYGQKLKEKNVL